MTTSLRPVNLAAGAYREPGASRQLRAIRKAADRVRAALDEMPPVSAVYSIPRSTLPYPTKFAFGGAALALTPLVSMLHRTLVVQFDDGSRLRTLLFNPTDVERARATPYFARFIRRVGPFERLLARPFPSLSSQLANIGLNPGDIDYLAFDHFHTQDLRGLLGTTDGSETALFPNAKLLAPAVEWDDWDEVHPLQLDFMIADGKRAVRTDAVTRIENDLVVGPGVLLVRTPGHTCGNQTLFIKTETGVWGVSENGTSADCWQPTESRIPGLRRHAKASGHEVIMNSNTPEASATQYASMILERTVVDRNASGQIQMWPSSEITPSMFAPGIRPSTIHGELRLGQIAAVTTAPTMAVPIAPMAVGEPHA